MLKKSISLILTLVLALGTFGVLPWQVSANAIESTGNSTLDAFINDSRWTNGVAWGASKMPNISPYQSWGCAAYCADYVKYCYNNNNPRSGEAFYSANETRAGDVITVGNPSDGNGHWFVVLRRSGNSLYVAEGSYAGRVRIGWNYTISGNGYTGTSYGFNTGYHYLADFDHKPYNVSLALEKYSFYPDEHVTYYCSATDVAYFIISIYDSVGNVVETVRINPGEYCTRYYNSGNYTAYCEAFNSAGVTFSNTISFKVYNRNQETNKPYDVSIDLEKYSFYSDEHVTYYCSGTDVEYFVISIYDGDGNIKETVRINPGEYCTRYYGPGNYNAFCEAYNSAGVTLSNTVKFEVRNRNQESDITDISTDITTDTSTDTKLTDTEKQTDTDKPTDSDSGTMGDVNGDGKVTMEDVVILQKYIAKLIDLTPEQFKLGDVDKNGEITMLDVTTMQKFIAKLIDKF
ncbi:MAG: dockerin type I repeat-containing protein [Clostridiales bacterium]|nr:dockerin type I repeat-containing protein [Clostridiales bacterium]